MKWGIGIAALVFVVLCALVATDLVTRHTASSAGTVNASPSTVGVLVLPSLDLESSRGPVHLPAHPKTLLSIDGSGAGRTQTFTTGTDWYLRYSYDCPSSVPEDKLTTLEIFVYSAVDENRPIANESEREGTDTLPQHGPPGPRYLRVESLCDWTVTVIG
jgi:hypothetical protein